MKKILFLFSCEKNVSEYVYLSDGLTFNGQSLGLPEEKDFFLTDNNWERGYAKAFAGFFVPYIYDQLYKAGNVIEFPKGVRREIVKTDRRGMYLNVYLSGDAFDSENLNLPIKLPVLQNGKDFFLTDRNWERGYARGFCGFFVPNVDKYRQLYKIGNIIKFPDGDKREIVNAVPSGMYLHVYLAGEQFNSENLNFPIKLPVIQKGK